MLAQFGARRVTRDIDILGRAFPGDEQEVTRRITQIAATTVDDGVTFEPATVIAEKLSTAIALGDLNTRDRDYAGLHQRPPRRQSLHGAARTMNPPAPLGLYL